MQEQAHFAAILEGMIEGVLVTNERGEILLANPALKSILRLETDCVGKTILECLRNKTIHEAIQKTLKEKQTVEEEVSLLRGTEEIHLILHTAPWGQPPRGNGSVTVFYDITRIRKLEQTRREFVANVSHEIKTPLTNILGYAETLRRGALEDKETSLSFVQKIENNAVQLKNLVEDILRLSAIESGRLEMNIVPLNLEEEITAVLDDFENKLLAKKIAVEKEIPRDFQLQGDRSALRQILNNLVDNAIKYTGEAGKITIRATTEDRSYKVAISDTGIGISEKDLPHVFERFYRVDKARSRQVGGTGLGLAIVKHLVQAHGGEVGVESDPGKGSCFTLVFPLRHQDVTWPS